MAEDKTEVTMVSKEGILGIINALEVKHPRAEEYKAKISRGDDCFAVMYDEKHPTCQDCGVLIVHEGKEMKVSELCKTLMGKPLKAAPIIEKVEAPKVEEISAPEAKEKKTKVEKVTKEGGRKDEIISAIKSGLNTQGDIVKKIGCQSATVNQILRKMVEAKEAIREKEGKSFIYRLK